MNGILDRFESKFVGRPVDLSALDAAPGQPSRESIVVVVSTVDLPLIRTGLGKLNDRRSAEFATAENERFVQQPSLIEILQQRSYSLITLIRQIGVVLFQIVVVVPGLAGAMPQLNEANAAFDHPSSDEQLARVDARPIEFVNMLRLLTEIKDVRRFHLHPVSQLERLDPGLQRIVFRPTLLVFSVESLKQIKLLPLFFQVE